MPQGRDRRFRGARRLTIAVVTIVVGLSCLIPVLPTTQPHASASIGASTSAIGYRLVASDGGIFNYGDAGFYGSTGGMALAKPVVGMAATPDGRGYWLVASDGGIFNYGDAGFYGSTGGMALAKPVVGMAATPDGRGYWLVASDGGIFNYGDAGFYGSTGGMALAKPVVGMAATPDGRGYWLVASDGGIFNYGDAGFYGSTGGMALAKPVVGMAATPDGRGYWLVASDGGIFNYGDAGFYGSTGGMALAKPVVGMAATPDGRGYWLVASDGGIFNYGDAGFYGSTGGMALAKPVVGVAVPGAPNVRTSLATATTSTTGTTGTGGATSTTTAPTTTTTAPVTTTTTATSPSGAMAPPPGYTASQRIFDDSFSGTALDSSRWGTALGCCGTTWNDAGELPLPYSGPTSPRNGGPGYNESMYAPSQVSVDNGLTLTAQANTNQWSSEFPWISGIVTTEGKFTLPTSGWYVQAKIKMPDTSQGMWPALWFLPPVGGTPFNEIDGFEGGMNGGSGPANQQGSSNYFADQGQQGTLWTTNGPDMSSGYHVYGVEWLPGQSITAFFDGWPVWRVAASPSVTVTAQPYQIMVELEVASQKAAGWHTAAGAGTPSSSMQVAEVQAYS